MSVMPSDLYAFVGATVLAVLALLHALVWRAQRERWWLIFAVAYGVAAVIYAFDSALLPVAGNTHPLAGAAACVVLLLLSLAMVDYVSLRGPAATWLRVGLSALLGMNALAAASGRLPRLVGFAMLALALVAQAGMALWAVRNEPRRGHALVGAALLLYPLVVAAAALGWLPIALLRYLVIAPTAVMGMTVLTTGLLRAQRHASDELARREQAEQALRALNDTLEQRVGQRTAELREMVDGLESFNRSISHDLRGPLGGIAGVARIAQQAVAKGDGEKAQRLMQAIATQAETSATLVAELLALARVGDAAITPEPIALESFVQCVLDELKLADPQAAAMPITLHELPEVNADPALLRQVYVNLVGNAVKFSSQVQHPCIELGAQQREGGPVLYVRDNGVGFDAAAAHRLFQPFQRLHDQRFAGHGIGLSIVKRIVERHGGRVWAQGEPGGGATFYFTLGGAAS